MTVLCMCVCRIPPPACLSLCLFVSHVVAISHPPQWCDVCRTFKSEYSRVKELALAGNVSVEIAAVNAEDERELMARFGVNFFPTFKVFRDGMLEDIGAGMAPLTGGARTVCSPHLPLLPSFHPHRAVCLV